MDGWKIACWVLGLLVIALAAGFFANGGSCDLGPLGEVLWAITKGVFG